MYSSAASIARTVAARNPASKVRATTPSPGLSRNCCLRVDATDLLLCGTKSAEAVVAVEPDTEAIVDAVPGAAVLVAIGTDRGGRHEVGPERGPRVPDVSAGHSYRWIRSRG